MSLFFIIIKNQKVYKYNNYINYNKYNKYKMETTTIALEKSVKKQVQEFGMKGETFSQIIERLLESANQRLLQDVLMNEEGCISIDEAIKEADKKWPK